MSNPTFVQPPCSLTGAQTSGENAITVGCDWISWTTKELQVEDIVDHLQLPASDWMLTNGVSNYREALKYGSHYTIMFNGTREDMGVHLRISGQGVQDLAHRTGGRVETFLGWLHTRGHFSRFDVAWDAFAGELPLDRIERDISHGNLTTRWKEANIGRTLLLAGEKTRLAGRIIRLGGRSSASFCRMYDKASQMGLEGQWDRCELETKGDRACKVVDLILREGYQSMAGVLRGLLCFRTPPNPRVGEACRWPIADYWDRFLAGAKVARITIPKPVRTVQDVAKWCERQVACSLAVLSDVPQFGPAYIERLVDEGRSRLSSRHLHIVKEATIG